MTDENTEKTFTQADINALKEQHQKDMDALAGKLRAEFKDKEAKAKAEAEKLAKQSNMSELFMFHYNNMDFIFPVYLQGVVLLIRFRPTK